jgi:hypothetical protein
MGVLEQYIAMCSLWNNLVSAVIVREPSCADYAVCAPGVQ